jgi:peptidoglycan/LPS O-acetylase OafA/YrhL
MNRLGPFRWWRIAASISVVVALLAIAFYDIPSLVEGADASRDPYWLVLGSFATDIVALVAAYGAWRRQVWGVVLLLVVNVFWTLQAVGTLLDPEHGADVVVALVMLALHAIVVWCCLRTRSDLHPDDAPVAAEA